MLNQDYKDILLCLKKSKADFVIVGAYAMAAHGFPRATGDIDIFVRADVDNASRVWKALVEFGAPVSDISVDDISYRGNIIQIGVAPCRVDIITNIDGVDFETVWANKVMVLVDDIEVSVISLDDLIANKSCTGRDKDRVDVESLKKIKIR